MTLLYQNDSSCCILLPNGLCLSCHYEVKWTSEWILRRGISYRQELSFQQEWSSPSQFSNVSWSLPAFIQLLSLKMAYESIFLISSVWSKQVNKYCLPWCTMLQLSPYSCLPQHAIKSCLHLYYLQNDIYQQVLDLICSCMFVRKPDLHMSCPALWGEVYSWSKCLIWELKYNIITW